LTAPDLKALELAKALATGADTILLDEVMAGLIPTEARKMVTVIKELRNAGMTFVLVEHIMPVMMELAERVIVLDFGQKIAEGKPGEIANSPKVIECYLGSGENLA
jgi:branched-chain amino acid transport system ATP-binding protein